MNYFILNKELKTVAIAQTDSSSRNAFHVLEDTFNEYSNAPSTLDLTLDFYNEKALEVKEGAHVVFEYKGVNRLFQIKQVEEYHSGDSYVKVYAEESSYELLDAVVFARDYTSVSAHYLLGIALADTDWQVGKVDDVTIQKYSFSAYATALSAVQGIAAETEFMLQFRVNFHPQKGVTGKYVDLLEKSKVDEGKRLEFGRNVESVKRTVDRTSVCTAVIPVGANDTLISGFDWVNNYEDKSITKVKDLYYVAVNEKTRSEINPNSDHHLFYVLQDESSDKSTLCKRAYEYLKNHKEPQYTYEVGAITLKGDTYSIGEQVRIIDDELGISLVAEVEQQTISFCNPDSNSIVLSNYVEKASNVNQLLYDIQNKLQTSVLDNPLIIVSPDKPIVEQVGNQGTVWVDTSQQNSNGIIILNKFDTTKGEWLTIQQTPSTDKVAGDIEDAKNEAINDSKLYADVVSSGRELKILKGDTFPTEGMVEGQLFIHTGDNDNMYRWNGTEWVLVGVSQDSIDAMQKEIDDAEAYIDEVKESLDGTKQDLLDAKGELDQAKADLAQTQQDLAKAKEDLLQMEEDIVDDLTGKVNTVQGEVDTLKNTAKSLQDKADELKAETTGLQGSVTSINSEIDEIQGQLEVTATKTEVQTLVDNVEIGGANILLNSKFDSTFDHTKWGGYSYVNIVNEDGYECAKVTCPENSSTIVYQHIYDRIKMNDHANQWYTFSGWFKVVDLVELSGSHTRIYGECNTESSPYAHFLFENHDITHFIRYNNMGWQKLVLRFKLPTDFSSTPNAIFQIYLKNTTGTIFFRELKIERGTKATSWTPAPEDIQSQITSANTAIDTTNTNLVNVTNRVTTNEANISANAQEIATKLNQTQVETITTKAVGDLDTKLSGEIDETNANLATTNENLANTNANVVSVTERVTQNEADIRLNAEEISTKLNQTQVETISQNAASDAVNNLQIGGRNLIHNSSFNLGQGNWKYAINSYYIHQFNQNDLHGNSSYEMARNTATGDMWTGLAGKIDLDYEDTTASEYTFSAWMYIFDDVTQDSNIAVELKGKRKGATTESGAGTLGFTVDATKNKWIYHSDTFTINPSEWEYLNVYFWIQINGHAKISQLKLEKGNKATAWTPAPEDIVGVVDTVTERVTSAESQITQHADLIATKVTASEVETISTGIANTSATNAVNNLKIGGTNLILNSSFKDYTSWSRSTTVGVSITDEKTINGNNSFKITYTGATANAHRGANQYFRTLNRMDRLEAGEYMFSIYVYTDDVSGLDGSAETGLVVTNADGTINWNNVSNLRNKLVNGKWVRVSQLINIPEGIQSAYARFNLVRNGTIYYSSPQLEKGNKLTEWSPAPEDVETELTKVTERVTTAESNITQQANLIATKVSQTEIDKAINDLKIGGRNLFTKTKQLTRGYLYYNSATLNSHEPNVVSTEVPSGHYYEMNLTINDNTVQFGKYMSYSEVVNRTLKANTTYVYSAYVWVSKDCMINGYGLEGSGNTVHSRSHTIGTIIPANTWTRLHSIFTPNTNNLTANYNTYMKAQETGDIIFRFSSPQLEEGNKLTDWTPALEESDGELNSIATRVSTAESTIEQHADMIASKVDKTTYETDIAGFETRISDAESTVTQTANSIESVVKEKVTEEVESQAGDIKDEILSQVNSDYTSFNTRLSNAESAITQKADSVTLTATKQELLSNIQNIEIGGRNYMLDSENVAKSATPNWQNTFNFSDRFIQDIRGKEITISAYIEADNIAVDTSTNSPHFGVDFRINYADGTVLWSNFTRGNIIKYDEYTSGTFGGKRYVRTIQVEDKEITSVDSRIVFIRGHLPQGTFTIKDIMIEIGNKASAYVPAPEDAENYIDEQITDTKAELKVTTDGIAANVSKNATAITGLQSTTSSMQTAITQNATDIGLRATKTEVQTVQSNLDNLQIGSENLLKNPVFRNNWNSWSGQNTDGRDSISSDIVYNRCKSIHRLYDSTNTSWREFAQTVYITPVETEQTFTFSWYAYSTNSASMSNGGSIYIRARKGNSILHSVAKRIEGLSSGKWKRTSVTITFTDSEVDNLYVFHTFNTAMDIYLAQPQLERGNRATDFKFPSEEMESRVTSSEASIKVNADAISLQAQKITTAEGNIAKNTAAIETNANAISIRATKDEVTKAINDIDIGGRNFYLNSGRRWETVKGGEYQMSYGNQPQSIVYQCYTGDFDYLNGRYMTFAFDVHAIGAYETKGSSGTDLRFGMHTTFTWSNEDYTANYTTYPHAAYTNAHGKSGRLVQTSLITAPEGYPHLFSITIALQGASRPTEDGVVWYIANPKLEVGNKATSWTPAPEDAENYTNEQITSAKAEIKVTTDAITSTVNENKTAINGLTSTTSSLQTQINQSKEAIELRATKTELEEAVDGVQGGTNMFQESGHWKVLPTWWVNNGGGLTLDTTEKYYGYNTLKTTLGGGIRGNKGNYMEIDPAKTYTFSAMVKSDTTWNSPSVNLPLHFHCTADLSVTNQGVTVVAYDQNLVAGEWKLIYLTFKPQGKYFRPYFYIGSSQSITINIAYIKMEEGTRATAWQPSPDEIDNRLSSAEASIKLNADNIALNVNAIEENERTISSHTTLINQNKEQIDLRATKTEVTNAINDISIGGRNLLLDSSFNTKKMWSSDGSYWSINSSTCDLYRINEADFNGNNSYEWKITTRTSNGWVGVTQRVEPRLDLTVNKTEKYTLSGWAYLFNDVTLDVGVSIELKGRKVGATSDTGVGSANIFAPGTTNVGKWTHFSMTLNINPSEWQYLYYFLYITKNGHVKVSQLKMEKGSKATDWTPAPEDIQIRVTSAEAAIVVNAEGISARATKTEVEQAIKDIQIGGTNQIRETRDFTFTSDNNGWNADSTWTTWADTDGFTVAKNSRTGATTNTIRSLYSSKFPVKAGDEVTMSCWINVDDIGAWDMKYPYIFEVLDSSGTRIQYQDVYYAGDNTNKPTFSSAVWTHFTSTHTITADGFCRMRLSLFKNGTIHIKKCKVEFGNKATAWSPAPEDAESRIKVAEATLNVLPNQINSKVSLEQYNADQQTMQSTLTSMNTTINQKADSTSLTALRTDFTNLAIGSRNLVKFGKGDSAEGIFKHFDSADAIDGYAEHTLASTKTYVNVSLAGTDGFALGCREYEVGEQYTWSYDIMFTVWDFPTGATRTEWWFGQRYTGVPSGETGTGAWASVTAHGLPVVGSNGCELNKWYHVEKTITIPAQASANIGETSSIQFYNNNADVTATVTFRLKNVKLEKGNRATDWTPSNEEISTALTSIESRISNAEILIESDAITQTVMESEAFALAMGNKADSDALAGYATPEDIAEAIEKQDLKGTIDSRMEEYINDPESNLNLNFVTQAQWENTKNTMNAQFSQANGLNFVHNSLGFGGVNDGYWIPDMHRHLAWEQVPRSGTAANITLGQYWVNIGARMKWADWGLKAGDWITFQIQLLPTSQTKDLRARINYSKEDSTVYSAVYGNTIAMTTSATAGGQSVVSCQLNEDYPYVQFGVSNATTSVTTSTTEQYKLAKVEFGKLKTDWSTVTDEPYIEPVYDFDAEPLGFKSSFKFSGKTRESTRFYQKVNLVVGREYTLSCYYKNIVSGKYVDIAVYGNDLDTAMSPRLYNNALTDGYKYYYTTFTATESTGYVKLMLSSGGEAYFTGIMLHEGSIPLKWSQATGEQYNSNIMMDINGIKVIQQDANKNPIGYTEITPKSFSGYYDTDGDGDYEEIFTLKEDAVVTKRTVATHEIIMGNLKFINLNSGGYTGWAMVPSTANDWSLTEGTEQ